MFIRESIYQALRYKAIKKGLHDTIEKFFQAQPSTICVANKFRTDNILWHMMQAQDV